MNMNPQCDNCTNLLLDYIAAANRLIDIDRRTPGSKPFILAKTAATAAHRYLVAYQRQLRCQCANKLRTRHAAATRAARKQNNLFA
jgi:hypothetical protein